MSKKSLIEAYKGKNVYITGITGFKGSWMALMLHHLGANVSGIGLEPEDEDSIFYTARVDEIADVVISDITAPADESLFVSSVYKANPDYIFHMAAQPLVSEGYKNPYTTFHTNIMGTVILHEILRGLKLPANKEALNENRGFQDECNEVLCKKISMINVTTDKVYREEPRALVEDDVLFGFDPYSLSKSCSDMISQAYRDAMGSEHYISTMRAGNVIGGGDMAANRIIPDIVRAAEVKGEVELRSPHSVRPYQHVFDAINAYLIIAAKQVKDPSLQGEWNVGPDKNQTMETHELADKMMEYLPFTWKAGGGSIGKENDYLVLDNTKIKNEGWVPAYATNDEVVKAVSLWYNNYMKGDDMQSFTLKQIEEAFESYDKNC